MTMLLMTVLFMVPGAAFGHALRLAAAPTSTGFAGRVFYSDDSPAIAETVMLLDAKGAELARTRTDSQGRFALAAPSAGGFTLVAEGEEGHRVERAMAFTAGTPAGDASPSAAGCSDGQALAAALRAELQPLREDLSRYEQRIRLLDVIGGIGFIVGVAGAWALWSARRNRPKGH